MEVRYISTVESEEFSSTVFLNGFTIEGEGGDGKPVFHRGDADDNGELQLTDAIRILGFLFLGAESLPPPGPMSCGEDPTEDTISCEMYTACP